MCTNFTKFSVHYLWPWLGRPPMTVQCQYSSSYFCGWCVFT